MRPIKAKFFGYQAWRRGRFALVTLLEPMGDHKAGSIVSTNTLALHGYKPQVQA